VTAGVIPQFYSVIIFYISNSKGFSNPGEDSGGAYGAAAPPSKILLCAR